MEAHVAGQPAQGRRKASLGLILIAVVLAISGKVAGSVFSAFASWPLALLLGLLFPAFIAYIAYGVLLPARSAQGSALALRTESFRRFLHASEASTSSGPVEARPAPRVQRMGGRARRGDAWADALEKANIPEPAACRRCRRCLVAPIFIDHVSRVAPR